MSKFRVLRLLEYTYDTAERMADDMSRWTIPANGSHRAGQLVIRSAVLPLEIIYPFSQPSVGAVGEDNPEDEDGKKNL